jgi:hypothetical protein
VNGEGNVGRERQLFGSQCLVSYVGNRPVAGLADSQLKGDAIDYIWVGTKGVPTLADSHEGYLR